eukprot:6184984-Pleurochrysis_carterae.AAC.1
MNSVYLIRTIIATFTLLQYCDVLSHSSLGEWRRDGHTYALSIQISAMFYKDSLDIGDLHYIPSTWSFRGNRHHVKHSCRSDASDRVAGDIPKPGYIPPLAYISLAVLVVDVFDEGVVVREVAADKAM